MRRFIIHAFVAALTFAIGITANILLNSFRDLSAGKTTGASMTISIETPPAPAKPYVDDPGLRRCGCHNNAGEVVDSPPALSVGMPPISGGVLNGKAISLPRPAYPAIARAARASGTVTVQATIDEHGCVISSRAVSGHPLLQIAAVQAARQACFSPTRLSGQPVKVTGVIIYNFMLS